MHVNTGYAQVSRWPLTMGLGPLRVARGWAENALCNETFRYRKKNQRFLPNPWGFKVLLGHFPQWQPNETYTVLLYVGA